MKKLLTIAFCGALTLMMGTPVNAAEEGINPVEQTILDRLEQGITVEGDTITFPQGSEEYEAIKQLLAIDGVDLTQGDYETIKTAVIDFQNFMTIHYNDEIDVESLNEMIAILNPAAQIFGIRFGYDAINDVLNGYDADGNIIYSIEEVMGTPIIPADPEKPAVEKPSTGNKLENTGDNYAQTFAVLAGLLGVILASGYSLNKRKSIEQA